MILARKYAMPIRVLCALSEGPETWIGTMSGDSEMTRDPKVKPTSSKGQAGPMPQKTDGGPSPAADPSPDTPIESDRILSVALESRCMMIQIEGQQGMSWQTTLAGILEEVAGPSSWLWVESFDGPQGTVVRGVCTAPGLDDRKLGDAVRGRGAKVQVHRDLAVASMVGEGILARPALLVQALQVLGEAGIEVAAARSGSLSISFVVPSHQAAEAVRLLHDRFVTAEL